MARRAFDLDEQYVVRAISDGERGTSSVPRGEPLRGPRPVGWLDLLSFNAPGTRCKRTAACIYAKLGLHPIALHGVCDDGVCTCRRVDCGAAGKHPVGKAWQRGNFNLTGLDRQLAENPCRNIGLRMGLQPNGRTLIAIDVDGPRSLLDPLEDEHGALPHTLTAKTSRGLHLLFWLAPGEKIRNRVHLAPGVDVRADGGQIVIAPSRHISGAYYEWLDVMEPSEMPE